MPNKANTSLEAINELSRQLLSQLDIQRESAESGEQKTVLLNADEKTVLDNNLQYSDEEMASLVARRHTLIDLLFKTFTQEQLSIELQLVNEMVLLDNQLTSNSQRNKQALAAQVLKLKKSKKITSFYQKY